MRRSRGFLAEAVKEIAMRPGQSATEIAKRLLSEGRATSMAKNPVGSLVATLHKYYAETRALQRRWENGQYRYYPRSETGEADPHPPQPERKSSSDDALLLQLPKDCREYISALVVLPQFDTSLDAIVLLLRNGMKSTRVS